jgi:predicted enzyme related to lactoylglutathione lyase
MEGGSLVMFKFVDRPAPRDQQSILGFVTDDLDGIVTRIGLHGGKLVGPTREMPKFGIRVQFAEDPEGALNEIVEMTAPSAVA